MYLFISGDSRGEFIFLVSDGVNTMPQSHKFVITAAPLMLELVHNHPLKVYPGQQIGLTTEHLLARTNDPEQRHPIIFNIERKPTKGRIITMYLGM